APARRRPPPSVASRPAQPGSGAEELGRLSPHCHRLASWEEANPGRHLPGDRTNALTSAGDALQSATPRLQIKPLLAGCKPLSPRCLSHIRRSMGSTTLAGLCALRSAPPPSAKRGRQPAEDTSTGVSNRPRTHRTLQPPKFVLSRVSG